MQRDPELKSFALNEWLYFSHFIKFLWKDSCSILGCFGYNMFIFEKGKLLYRLPYFSARPLTVKVEEKTNYNNSVEGALSYALWNLTLTKKLLVKDKIAVSCATNTLPSVISNFKNNKNELWKTVGLTIFHKPTLSIRFNLVQVCPSESSFIIAVLLVHSFIMFLVFIFIVFH